MAIVWEIRMIVTNELLSLAMKVCPRSMKYDLAVRILEFWKSRC